MKLSLLTIAMWLTNSLHVKEISSCNITMSPKSNLVDLGSRVSLTYQVCSSTNFINFYHNGSHVASYAFGESSVVNKSLYHLTYDAVESTFNLTIMNFTRSSVGNYSCSIPYTTNNASLTLEHSVPVTFVTLTPATPTISVLQNITTNVIKCISSEGRPKPSITWYLDKNTPSDYTDDLNLTLLSFSETIRYVTMSTLTITATMADHGSSIYCKVSNGYGHITSNARLNINVLVVPSRPTILHKSVIIGDNISVTLNSTVPLECNSSGNPTPNISWLLSNGSVINKTLIELKWENRVNTDMITCMATSVMKPAYGTTQTHSNTTDLRINILYSPSTPTCSIGDKFITVNTIRAIKNEPININCTSKSNPPPTSYSWTLPGGIKQDGQQLSIPRVLLEGPYTLDVNNVINSTLPPQVIIGHANVIFTLDILFPVAVHNIENKTVLRNQALSATCPYTLGNPPETNFTWIHVNTSRVVGREQRLALPNMQTTDEGLYKCRVNTTMTPTGCCALPAYDETIFYVDVQYAADITRFYASGFEHSQTITVNENETVILYCDSEGDPLPSMLLINNTRGENDLLSGKYYNTISAYIPHARCEYDMGIYQCRANNTHNKVRQVREIEIKIKCAPRSSPFMPPAPKVWTKINSSVILTYTIMAYPPPSSSSAFVWRKKVNEDWFIVNDTSKRHIQISQDRLQTNLSIFQVHADDFTNYTVKVNNDIGTTEQTFVIQTKEEPAIPEHFRVSEDPVTDNTVIVEWKPAFNGGENQWFVIGYKQETGKNWTYKTKLENITRIAIEGLVAGTSYQFKMYAENSVGRSQQTIVLTLVTRAAKADNGSSSPVGAAVGVAVGGILMIVICIILWKCRNTFTFKRKPDASAPYDDLFKGQTNVLAVNTSSEYEECRVESQQRDQYETLAETSFHVYSAISRIGTEGISIFNRESVASDNDCAVGRKDRSYVNLVLSKTEN
ncbi:synaptogenesis protein syg-2-like [Dreissena polymorpha]|uniref:synaptogenesis protein syg-2-like n=1 Tax=Dreissena polymorpha TaxID=45954 RepID=UPI0022643D59|nr:synaptogenesis protein syg-2-like [Dreissena polymorpha]